jgi:hypothetical protein
MSVAAMLMITSVLGVAEPLLEEPISLDAPAANLDAEPEAPISEGEAVGAETTGPGDPLYDRLFTQAEPPEVESAAQPSLPKLPGWLWMVGLAGLGGLYTLRQRQRGGAPKEGEVEVLGHTRMGSRSRLTVIRVVGEDGRKRRLLVSTGEGTPSLVADLGSEADAEQELSFTAPAPQPAPQPAQPALTSFHRALDEAVSLDEEIIDDDDDALPEGVGLGRVPPPKVPVWNETPDEFHQVAPVAAPPEPVHAEEPAAPTTPMEALDAMLDEGDAPEMVMDVSWDPETGWRGLPELAPTTAAEEEEEPAEVEPVDSWEDLLEEKTGEPDVLDRIEPSSSAAYEALLGGNRRPREPRLGRVRPPIQTVKPLRPWQAHAPRRTPYDRVVEEPLEPSFAPEVPAARSASEVQDLVAEVLNERSAEPSAKPNGNGVVELARYLRRQVAP